MLYIAPDVFYYWLVDDETYGDRATEIIQSIEKKTKAITSVLTLIELDRKFRGQTNYTFTELLNRIVALKYLKLMKIEPDLFEEAQQAMNLYNLTIENGIHFATANNAKTKSFFTNDTSFENTPLSVTSLSK